jgi:8-oxo-dGTP diphosphatase
MTNYVCGFMFSRDLKHVVLIKKNKPLWQEGMWNGVGGKVEEGEDWFNAMSREFLEETGVETEPIDWTYFNTEQGEDWKVNFYYIIGPVNYCKTVEEEEVRVMKVTHIWSHPLIDNLYKLIPQAVFYLL